VQQTLKLPFEASQETLFFVALSRMSMKNYKVFSIKKKKIDGVNLTCEIYIILIYSIYSQSLSHTQNIT
jgi:hypothetical protein